MSSSTAVLSTAVELASLVAENLGKSSGDDVEELDNERSLSPEVRSRPFDAAKPVRTETKRSRRRHEIYKQKRSESLAAAYHNAKRNIKTTTVPVPSVINCGIVKRPKSKSDAAIIYATEG
jgi:hypothetical protein